MCLILSTSTGRTNNPAIDSLTKPIALLHPGETGWGKWGWKYWALVPLRPAENKELGQVGSRITVFPSERLCAILIMLGIKKKDYRNASM